MLKAISYLVMTAALLLTAPAAHCVTSEPEWVQGTNATSRSGTSVIHIVVEKVQDDYIYSRDGRKFQISHDTKVTSKKSAGRMRTAELIFQNDRLVSVNIK